MRLFVFFLAVFSPFSAKACETLFVVGSDSRRVCLDQFERALSQVCKDERPYTALTKSFSPGRIESPDCRGKTYREDLKSASKDFSFAVAGYPDTPIYSIAIDGFLDFRSSTIRNSIDRCELQRSELISAEAATDKSLKCKVVIYGRIKRDRTVEARVPLKNVTYLLNLIEVSLGGTPVKLLD